LLKEGLSISREGYQAGQSVSVKTGMPSLICISFQLFYQCTNTLHR